MSSGDGSSAITVIKVVIIGAVAGVMGIRGCAVQSQLTPNLEPIEVGDEAQQVPGTKFKVDGEPAQVVELHGKSDLDLALEAGMNVLELTCSDSGEYNYDFRGAHGEIEVGQPVNFAGSEDDVTVERPNGESLRITNDCPGGKGTDYSKVYINVER